MSCQDEGTGCVPRRKFVSLAAAAAAGWVLTGCGPRRLVEIPRERRRELLEACERTYRQAYATDVTVADTPALPGVTFAYALDLSRCVGCRRCVYACVDENNPSRDPQVHWIRVLRWRRTRASTSRTPTRTTSRTSCRRKATSTCRWPASSARTRPA